MYSDEGGVEEPGMMIDSCKTKELERRKNADLGIKVMSHPLTVVGKWHILGLEECVLFPSSHVNYGSTVVCQSDTAVLLKLDKTSFVNKLST